MSHPRFKSENYTNFGGINTKTSPYITGPHEFLDLANWDFQTPGSLTKRWGTTQYIGTSLSGQVLALYEYEKLDGYSSIIFATGSSLWYHYGAGYSALAYDTGIGTTQPYVANIAICNSVNLSTGNGISMAYDGITVYLTPRITGASQYKDLGTFNNVAYSADGQSVYKISDNKVYYYGVPQVFLPIDYKTNQALKYKFTFGDSGTPPTGSAFAALNTQFNAAFEYEDLTGHKGPLTEMLRYRATETIISTIGDTRNTITSIQMTLGVPLGYGINKINCYVAYGASSQIWYFAGSNPVAAGVTELMVTFALPSSIRTSKTADVTFPIPSQATYVGPNDVFNYAEVIDYELATNQGPTYSYFIPTFLEIYNNQLFTSGFSAALSTVRWTSIGEGQESFPDDEVEIRTQDGDKISAMKSYGSRLLIFKKNSMHMLSGDDPENFQLRQITDEYGCLNNRSVAVYHDMLMFLDRRGMVRWDGANYQLYSNKIQPIFDRMNVPVAEQTACMVHDKARNQVLCAIPVDGSSVNNLTVVYDYLADAWTTYKGYNPSIFAIAKGNLQKKYAFYGNYTGQIFSFGPSFFGDNGSGITTFLKTRYLHEMGQSTEKQWRRLYLNVDPVTGSTSQFTIEFMKDYSSTISLTRTMYQNPFQSRIDFGIPAKSLAFNLSNFSAVDSIRMHGYVLEYRYQRST